MEEGRSISSSISSLLPAQCEQGVEPCGAACGNIAGDDRNRQECDGDDQIGEGIVRACAVKHAADDSAQNQSSAYSYRDAEQSQHESVSEHQVQNIGRL